MVLDQPAQYDNMSIGLEKGKDLRQPLKEFIDLLPERVTNVLREMEIIERKNPRMRNVTRELGYLLYRLVIDSNFKLILDLGTSNGCSALWLGSAAQQTGGEVISIENQPWKADMARQNITKAGLSESVTVFLGDAVKISENIDKIDLLFMDIWPGDYLRCIQGILPNLRQGSLIVVDNLRDHRERDGTVISRRQEGDDYLTFIHETLKIPVIDMPNIGSGAQIGLFYTTPADTFRN